MSIMSKRKERLVIEYPTQQEALQDILERRKQAYIPVESKITESAYVVTYKKVGSV